MPTLCVLGILGPNKPKSLPSWGLHSSGREKKETDKHVVDTEWKVL